MKVVDNMDSSDHQMDCDSPPPSGHQPAQRYSLRVPSPPRIIVPPPTLNPNGLPDLNIPQKGVHDFEASGFGNVDFLSKVTYGNFITQNNMLEWKYEQRRTAQRILPFLYLGPMSAAKDKDFLQRENITMVLAVKNTLSAQAKLLGSRAAEELGLEVRSIDVAGNQELIAAYPEGIEMINAHLSSVFETSEANHHASDLTNNDHGSSAPGKVLVYCESGNERSATLVTAYIMAMYSVDLLKSIQIVQAQRFAVAFDDSLRNLLATYETILVAKRDVLRDQQHSDGQLNEDGLGSDIGKETRKRGLEDVHDTEMSIDSGGDNDGQDFRKRDGRAPFQDVNGV